MAAFNFPNSPSTNQVHTENSVTWKWNGVTWKRQGFNDKIEEGNTSAEVVDTGSDGHFKVTTEGTERVRITGDGLGINVTPGRELHVKGADAIIRVESTYATGRNTIEFQDTSAQKGYIGYPSSSNDHFCI